MDECTFFSVLHTTCTAEGRVSRERLSAKKKHVRDPVAPPNPARDCRNLPLVPWTSGRAAFYLVKASKASRPQCPGSDVACRRGPCVCKLIFRRFDFRCASFESTSPCLLAAAIRVRGPPGTAVRGRCPARRGGGCGLTGSRPTPMGTRRSGPVRHGAAQRAAARCQRAAAAAA